MTHLFLLPLLLLNADEPRWELAADTSGVKVYGRKKAGSEVREMKALGVIDAPPAEVWKAVRDYDAYTTSMPYIEENKVLAREGGDKVTWMYSKINAPLVDRRDYIIKLTDESEWKDGKGFYKVTWTAVNDMDDKVPVKSDVVRVRINDGSWVLEPRDDGKKTFAVYFVYTSPGGSIPTFIANQGNTVAVPKVFEAIKKTVAAGRAAK